MNLSFRPIDVWPGALTPSSGRRGSPFGAGYEQTRRLLESEISHLDGVAVVLQIALREADIRRDGHPRANARAPEHPGVILAFSSKHGPLRYSTDRFDSWQANLRAIALALEALRKVDRYGIGQGGEQYRGWQALNAGPSTEVERGRDLIRVHGGVTAALHATHPDKGGDPADLRAVMAAREADE